ncbi:MAG: LysM peptidoglycan-binding domain-containing protein [Thermoleophilia bacterium]|nr:LysM peptidoglycan-binding domain-containing protein [Thermoleophilia bacterium]
MARLAVLVVVIALAVWLGVRVATASGSVEPVVHEVRAGETVWGIAERTYSADTDLRRAVYEIERLNALRAGGLQPGDELVLPAEGAL